MISMFIAGFFGNRLYAMSPAIRFVVKLLKYIVWQMDFCKFFDTLMKKYTLKNNDRRNCHRDSTMSKAEVMLIIIILFHDSGYRCLKHFYVEKVCKYLRHLFPNVVSYNRFVELQKDVVIPLTYSLRRSC